MASAKLIRAKVTDAEWAAFRKHAIDLGVPPSVLAGDALRDKLPAALRDALLKGAKP